MKATSEIRYAQKELLIDQEVEGETIILNPESGDFFCLNGIASCIWPLLGTGQTIEDVTVLIAEGLNTPVDACKADVHDFFDQMLRQGLIEPATDTQADS